MDGLTRCNFFKVILGMYDGKLQQKEKKADPNPLDHGTALVLGDGSEVHRLTLTVITGR
jgi:hypothetical protein